MENGQADDGPGTLDDIAQFLVDNPGADTEEEEQTSEESQEGNSDESADGAQDTSADDEADEADSDKPKEQTSGLKFKVPIKGEDGQDTTIEVDEKELVAGYQRHADYTRKTQDLANREREVTQAVAQRLEEGRTHYLQQAQLARAAVLQLAGLKSPQEMAALAQADPSQWVLEQQRQQAVQGVLAQLEQGMSVEQQRAMQQRQQEASQQISRAWGVLGQQGIDKPKLEAIYEKVSKGYGVPMERLLSVTDPALVLLMRDAVEFQGLKQKKAEVTKKASDAPKLPQRQSVPKNEQKARQLNQRFSSGKAKLSDLAAYIANS